MAEPLTLPKTLFRKKFGLGIDSGGSCFKIVYTTEENDKLHFNFVTFPQTEYLEALAFIKKTCGDKLEAGEEIVTCGVSANEQYQIMADILGIRLKNTNEHVLALDGMGFLSKNLPWNAWIKTGTEHALKEGISQSKVQNKIAAQWEHDRLKLHIDDSEIPDEIQPPPECMNYPVLINVLGSVPVWILVQSDGTASVEGFNSFGGKAFIGLSKYFTDGKDFDELVQMAQKGDHKKVHQMFAATGSDSSDSTYGSFAMGDNLKLFDFGHLTDGKKDTDPNDLVAALLSTTINSMVMKTCMRACMLKVPQVFYYGGFACSKEYIQDMITSDHVYYTHSMGMTYKSHHYFIKHGAHLSAIGSLLANLELIE